MNKNFALIGEVIVIAGGYTDTSIAEVEVYSPLGNCQYKVTTLRIYCHCKL